MAPSCSGNSPIFMPATTTVPHSPVWPAHHNTTQSDATTFVEAILPQEGRAPNVRELAPSIYKFTPHSRVVIPSLLSVPPSPVSDCPEADEFEDDLVEIERIWSHVFQSNDEALAPYPCSCHMLTKGSCPVFLAKNIKYRYVPAPNMDD